MHDLIGDPLIGVRTRTGEARLNLPDLLASLAGDEVEAYSGLRAHQADPWHVFLVQIAASILARHPGLKSPPADAAFWRVGLIDIAEGCASAWELLVEDVTMPAFMQHPLSDPEELRRTFKPKARTPDELDVLVTAKNHDLKRMRAHADDPEAWLFAILCYQTTSGFLGAGNYGIVRMNGGFSSRPFVTLVRDASPAPRFREEVRVVCEMRQATLDGRFGYRKKGIVLTWLEPWDRTNHQYTLKDLEPWFVETARPLRLVTSVTGRLALGATSSARQIGPKTLESGDVGDPWTPINVADTKKGRSALTVSAAGWTADRVAALMFEQDFELTEMQRPRGSVEGNAWFIGSVLVRGQGTTDGFHRFAIPVPATVCAGLLNVHEKQLLGGFAEGLLADAKEVERALRFALLALTEAGPQGEDVRRKTAVRWSDQAAAGWSGQWRDAFFPTLWRAATEDRSAVRAAWHAILVALARSALRDAECRMPLPSARRLRALVNSESRLNGLLRKKGLLPDREGIRNDAEQESAE